MPSIGKKDGKLSNGYQFNCQLQERAFSKVAESRTLSLVPESSSALRFPDCHYEDYSDFYAHE